MFHSLQYIPFVLRYKINESKTSGYSGKTSGENNDPDNAHLVHDAAKFSPEFLIFRFILLALFLGFLGFHAVPMLFDAVIPYDKDLYGPTLFMFMFVVFINIHHYFIDNVLWRKENKNISQYLFIK